MLRAFNCNACGDCCDLRLCEKKLRHCVKIAYNLVMC